MVKRFASIILFLCLAAPGLLGAPPLQIANIGNSIAAPNAKSTDRFSEDIVKAHPGPWGELQWTSMYLEAPDYVLDTLPSAKTAPKWIFPGATKATFHELFNRAGLPSRVEARLLAAPGVHESGALTLAPTAEELEALSPEMRAVIYGELAKSDLNEYYHDPIVITGALDDWLRDTQLRPQLQDEIRKLSYHSGGNLLFSDLQLLFSQAKNDAEVKEICRMTSRTRTLMGSLRIPPGGNLKQLSDYWTGGRTGSDILPLLETSAERTGGASLDITHLLPPFARRRIYTYPATDFLIRGRMPDCHWTSLNFFNNVTQDYYLDMRLAANRLLGNYAHVDSPYRFGDLLCFLNTAGEGVHSCIYVADDVVFTKNGENKLRPWILMPLEEVRNFYGRETATISGFRRRLAGAE